MRGRYLVSFFALLASISLALATPDQEIARLIKLLGSAEFNEREKAERALQAIGEPALADLEKEAAGSADLEIRRRCDRLIHCIQTFRVPVQTFVDSVSVHSVAFIGNSGKFLSGRADSDLRLWDRETGLEIRRFNRAAGRGLDCQIVAVSLDSQRALTGGAGAELCLWEIPSLKQIRFFTGHIVRDGPRKIDIRRPRVNCVAFAPDGRRAASCDAIGFTRIWDVESGKELRCFSTETPFESKALAFSPDGKYIVTSDFAARLWEVETGKQVRVFDEPIREVTVEPRPVYRVAFSPDGKTLLTASGDGVAIWAVESGKELRRFRDRNAWAVSADFRRALARGEDKVIYLWDLETGKTIRRIAGHKNIPECMAFSPDGQYAVTAAHKEMFLWKLPK